ncbi:MAG: double-strand break repair helicase AddA [Emcibacter sp.]|nr:double-strand break repair helicase AddA [Emcibacter sp.]
MIEQTKDQRQASDPSASVWVAASAGTGKTSVLTNRVLRILLTAIPPERLLCLTFTKTAAAEMANRINRMLGQWVNCSEEDLYRHIKNLTGKDPSRDQINLARKLFARVLEVPGGLKIQTIHSFCQSLLGRFPLEAGIAPHFQVMDERTTLEHLAKARDAVLTESRPDINQTLAHALTHISRIVTENSFGDLIKALIGQRSGLERMLRRHRTVENVVSVMAAMLDIKPSDTVGNIIGEAYADGNFDEVGLRAVIEALQTGSPTNQAFAQDMAIFLSHPDDRRENFDRYRSVFLTKTSGEIRKILMPKKMVEAWPMAFLAMENEADRIFKIDEKIKTLMLLDNSKALLRIGAAMLEAFKKSKTRHAVMDYDDLILKVTGLIGNSAIADWILFKLDGGIDHILIDEAQDTNPEQWQVVKALANEFFVGEGQSEVMRTIFAVGDVKQSIYSFQRADPKEFVENRQNFQKKSQAVQHHFHNVNLALSFRSTAAVLNLVDQVFESITSRMALTFSDDEILHSPSRMGEAGLVELWPTEEPDEIVAPDDWQLPVIQEPSQSAEMKLAIRIAQSIAGWINNGDILTSKARPIGAGDIMILVRRRTKFDDYMIRALKARGIAVAGQDKMLLSEQMAVMDLMAVGNFVLLPSDDLTLAVVLKSPFIGFSEDDLYDLAYGRTSNLWANLLSRKSERPIFKKAHDFLTSLSNFADTAPPFEFYSYLLTTLEGRKKLLSRLGEEANDPIDEFLQLAMGYEVNNISSLQGFLTWVDRGNVEIKRDMEQGQSEVRIMTVHAAKGLQAPIVILPDTCQVPKLGSQLLWAGQEGDEILFWPSKKDFELGPCKAARDKINLVRDQEYLRLLYVAMTRAEDRLYITGWNGKNDRSENCWYDIIQRTLENMTDAKQGDGTEDGYLWRLTCPQGKTIKEEISLLKSLPKESSLPFWVHQAAPIEHSLVRPLSPSRMTEDEPAVISPLKSKSRKSTDNIRFNRGRIIHRLLEILPDMPTERQFDAAQRFLSQSAYGLRSDDVTKIIEQVRYILEDERFAEVFSPHSRAEVSLVGLAGTVAVSGQVDRLVVTDSRVLIIDYKTNRPPPHDVMDVPRLYLRQMAAYRAVLADIYPDKTIICLLLWTDVARLMELPEAMLEQIKF